MDRVWYEAGNEHSPTDPLGRLTLDLAGDGTLRVDHHGRSGHRAWTATVDGSVLDRLRAALRAAGFPAAPMVPPMAGDRMRALRVTGEPAGEVLLPWYDALELPGYDAAFGLLDSLVAQVTGLDLRAAALEPAAVHVRQVE